MLHPFQPEDAVCKDKDEIGQAALQSEEMFILSCSQNTRIPNQYFDISPRAESTKNLTCRHYFCHFHPLIKDYR